MITCVPCVLYVVAFVVVPVTVPAQASVVVGTTAVPVHSAVISVNVGAAGSVISSMITF